MLSAVAVAAGLLLAAAGRAEPIAPFKLTGTEGYATLNYLSDDQTSDQPETGRLRTRLAGWRSELFVMTHSYVYHPNLLSLDIGGGPILHNENFLDDRGNSKASGLMYNFSARANFLREKPYRGTLFYSHLNPTVSVAPGQVMTQENNRLGLDFSLLAPVTPVPLQFNFVRSGTRGRGGDRVIDDRTDQLNVLGTRSFGAVGSTQLQFQTSRQESKSGSLDLPLQSSSSGHHGVNADTRLQLGDKRQYELSNLISVDRQDYAIETRSVPALSDLRFMLDGRARHSEQARSYASFNYGRTSQGTLDMKTQDAAAGVSYWPAKDIELGAAARGGASRTQQFTADWRGVDGSARYERELPLGKLVASYSARFDQREQVASAPQVQILGERISLTGSDYVTLAHPHIVAGTPVVSNATRTQVFVEGVDYRLAVFGNDTRIQRLAGGRMLEGEPLLVDYSYAVGGTYAFNQTDQTFTLNWNLSRYGGAYFRHFGSSQRLLSGQPTFALNEVSGNLVGARVDVPYRLGLPLTFGATIEREVRHETITSFRRSSFDGSVQTDEPVLGLGFLRGSIHRQRIDYGNVAQNSNLRSHDLRYWWRNAAGMDLTAGLLRERDAAGLLPRQRREGSLGLQWRKRKLSVSANLVRTYEAQGGIERRRMSVQAQARRDL